MRKESEDDLKKICKGAIVEKGLPVNGSKVYELEKEVSLWAREKVGC